MTSRNGYEDFVRRVAQLAEVPLVCLKRPKGHSDGSWRISAPGVPVSLVIRETEEALVISGDWLTVAAQTLRELEDPTARIAGTAGLGIVVGGLAGRSANAALVGGVLGGLVGFLSQDPKRGNF